MFTKVSKANMIDHSSGQVSYLAMNILVSKLKIKMPGDVNPKQK